MSISIAFFSRVLFGGLPGLRPRFVCAAIGAVVLLASATLALAQSPTPAPANPSPTYTMPAALAPAPFALPGSTQALQKQLSGLLRQLEPVQSAEVLITGQAPEGQFLKVLIRCRQGRRLTPEMLNTMSEMLIGALPGLAADHLTIADSSGRLLYAHGQVFAPPPSQPLPRSGLAWLTLAAVAAVAVAASVIRSRGPSALPVPAEEAWLGGADVRRLAEALATERPEVATVVLGHMSESAARRLRRLLSKHGMKLPLATAPADPRVVAIVLGALQKHVETRRAIG